jgi:hypothetical protein
LQIGLSKWALILTPMALHLAPQKKDPGERVNARAAPKQQVARKRQINYLFGSKVANSAQLNRKTPAQISK